MLIINLMMIAKANQDLKALLGLEFKSHLRVEKNDAAYQVYVNNVYFCDIPLGDSEEAYYANIIHKYPRP